MFSSRSANRSPGGADEVDPVGERILGAAGRVAAGEADDLRVAGGHRQQAVAVARDQDRHLRHVLAQELGDVLQILNALTGSRVGQLGGLEFLVYVTSAQPKLQPTAGQVGHRSDVAGQQGL